MVTIFLSGKMISTGAADVLQSFQQLNRAKVLLLVQNIVATLDLGSRLDFSRIMLDMSNYTYEPEIFPGIIYKTVSMFSLLTT